MTKLIYLTDSYKKTHLARVVAVSKKSDHYEVVLDETIFYPQGGGQPSDRGEIKSKKGELEVTHVRFQNGEAIHEGKLVGVLIKGDAVTLAIDWDLRYDHMRWHSAGHILHEIVMQTIPGLVPLHGEHGKHAHIEYQGMINPKLLESLEKQTNLLIANGRKLSTEMLTLEELKKRAAWLPPKLPGNKPLRILQVSGYPPIPDGGTQVKNTREVGPIKVTAIEQLGNTVRVHYAVAPLTTQTKQPVIPENDSGQALNSFQDLKGNNQAKIGDQQSMNLNNFRTLILELQSELLSDISQTNLDELEPLHVKYFGTNGSATKLIRELKKVPVADRKSGGLLVNEFKQSIESAFNERKTTSSPSQQTWFDTSLPGIQPPMGHLHIVSQAISEITRIFERIGFTRVRHPEVDWDYYAFESLNMPPDHPARDEWETFFIGYPGVQSYSTPGVEYVHMVLTPHTSNGQVREMEKGKLPIRMINIAKCYRRQSDVSHVPMFHQFEGLFVDKIVSIGDLKGVMDFFFKQYYGPDRKSRLRPYHFQFTEPSFEVDINCGVCLGRGCKLCKDGWLELGGAGMVHPNVLKYGRVDPDKYTGFAFGWGVERVAMMKSGTRLDDIRLLYGNDLRFLEQF